MRMIFFAWIFLIGITVLLLGQAFRLQIVTGDAQALRATRNRFRIRMVPASRGIFYDAFGKPLIESDNEKREYLYGEITAHILGYIGEADSDELVLFGVEPGHLVGKMGLEREEDGLLRGSEGGILEEFSADGSHIRTISQTEPVGGRSLQLSLDVALQQLAYEALQTSGFNGAVVVSAIDGQILTLATFPSFDPNLFTSRLFFEPTAADTKKLEQTLIDEGMPMFNRAMSGLYPPASTFKIVTSLAALSEGVIDEDTEIEDTGEITIDDFRYGTWYFDQYGRKEGMMDVVKALQRSNDIFFYKVGEELGIEALSTWAKRFGLGKVTGIGLTGESAGLVPSPTWKREYKEESWFLGDTYITAIGQGDLQTTPLQVHQMMAAIANGGRLCQPSLVTSIVDNQPDEYHPTTNVAYQDCTQLPVAQKHLRLVIQGLEEACAPGGTGSPLFNFSLPIDTFLRKIDEVNYFEKEASNSAKMVGIPVACKTGTAETGRARIENGKKVDITHAWFTVYAPIKDPEIVITVLLEEGGQGSGIAAEIAKEILEVWFER